MIRRLLAAALSLLSLGLMAVYAWQMVYEMTPDRDFFIACGLILGFAALFGVSLSLRAVRDFASRYPRTLYVLGGLMLLGWVAWIAMIVTDEDVPTGFSLYGGSVLFVLGVLVAAMPYVARATPGVSKRTDVSP
jgi:hypothetical protein